mmetsp:Transcript_30876/g.84740  ORF Transcript_30876/g.84740 Transcript_30876/m.84740 type:complete len:378 (+) Transcript_30876:91-1224(+)
MSFSAAMRRPTPLCIRFVQRSGFPFEALSVQVTTPSSDVLGPPSLTWESVGSPSECNSPRPTVVPTTASGNEGTTSTQADAAFPKRCTGIMLTLQSPRDEPPERLPGSPAKTQRRRPNFLTFVPSPRAPFAEGTPRTPADGTTISSRMLQPPRPFLLTPSVCSSAPASPIFCAGTPEPQRCEFRHFTSDVSTVLFDFDGTLTATPGDRAPRRQKHVELCERAPLLAPHLKGLRDAGLTIGIVSKSTEQTIRSALQEAGLNELFNGPIVGRALGLEGKVGFIQDLLRTGNLGDSSTKENEDAELRRILLVDDDVFELERARAKGLQTYAAPTEGGLQEAHLNELLVGLGFWAGRSPRSPWPPHGPHRGRRCFSASGFE